MSLLFFLIYGSNHVAGTFTTVTVQLNVSYINPSNLLYRVFLQISAFFLLAFLWYSPVLCAIHRRCV